MSSLFQQKIIEIARQRIGFKIHLLVYILVNIIVWLTWLTNVRNFDAPMWIIIWLLWTTVAWGVGGIPIHDVAVYHKDKFISANREAERLKKRMFPRIF